MANITRCSGEGCDIKHTCFRFIDEPNKHLDNMFIGSPVKFGDCEYYINKNK